MRSKKKISFKNYIILGVIIIATILLTIYIKEWFDVYNENKYIISPLNTNVKEININEVHETLYETDDIILYISYNNDKNIFMNEEKILNLIKEDNLYDNFIYLNINDKLLNNEYIDILVKELDLKEIDIKKVPAFIYCKRGEVIKVINSKDKIVGINELKKLVKQFEIKN